MFCKKKQAPPPSKSPLEENLSNAQMQAKYGYLAPIAPGVLRHLKEHAEVKAIAYWKDMEEKYKQTITR